MVKEETIDEKKYFICEICGFAFREINLAEKCEGWCDKNGSYNMEIKKPFAFCFGLLDTQDCIHPHTLVCGFLHQKSWYNKTLCFYWRRGPLN